MEGSARTDLGRTMEWLMTACLLICLQHATTTNVELPQNDGNSFEGRLSRAALDVVYEHFGSVPPSGRVDTDWSTAIPSLPHPRDFMHSYFSNTGVGNREEIVIDAIREEALMTDVHNVKYWRYIRHNSSDFVLAVQSTRLVQWKADGGYNLLLESATHVYEAKLEGEIIDAMFFTRTVKNRKVLYIASMLEDSLGVTLRVHEVNIHYAISVMVMHLKNRKPFKLAYVESQFDGSLVLMYSSPDRAPRITSVLKGQDKSYRVIEVYTYYPVDLTTFTINGFGYIAVAYHGGCDIFRMDEFADNHYLFDRIEARGIIGLASFRLGFEHFLTIATPESQDLYVWHGGGFFPKQSFNIPHTLQIFSVYMPTCRDDVFLFIITGNEAAPVILFVWSGQQQKFVMAIDNVMDFIGDKFLPKPNSLVAFTTSSTALVLLVDHQEKSRMISLHSRLGAIPDPVVMEGYRITHIMSLLKHRLEDQQDFLDYARHVLERAVRQKGNQIIRANNILNNMKVVQDVLITQVIRLDRTKWQGSSLTLDDLKWSLDDLQRNLTIINQLLDDIMNDLNDVALTDQITHITGHKRISGIQAPGLNLDNLELLSSAGFDVRDIQSVLFRTDSPRPVGGRKHFQGSVISGGSIKTGLINGVLLSREAVTTNTAQTLQGLYTFQNHTSFMNVQLSGTINGINVAEDVVTLGGNHHVQGLKTFISDVHSTGDATAKFIDGVDFDDLMNRAVVSSNHQIIPSTKTIRGNLVTGDVSVGGSVSGIDVSELARHVVRTDVPATFMGRKIFVNGMSIKNDLAVRGPIDGMFLPAEAFLPNEEQTITASKNIRKITASQVSVTGPVDGVVLDDVVTLTGDEFIEGTKAFSSGIAVEKDVIVEGTVDSVKLSQLDAAVLKKSDLLVQGTAKFIGPVTIEGDLHVDGLTNEVDLSVINQDAIFKYEQRAEITAPKIMARHSEVKELRTAGKINGLKMPDGFLLVNGNQHTNGIKTFNSFVLFGSHLASNGVIDGVNFAELFNSRVSLSEPGVIEGRNKFIDDATILGDVLVSGTIDGIRPEQVVLIHSDQEISRKTFKFGLATDLLIGEGDAHVGRFVDGVDLSDLFARRVTLTTDQGLRANYAFGNVSASEVGVMGTVNGINITRFVQSIVSLTRPQNIIAPKSFKGPVSTFGDIKTSVGVNGRQLNEVNAGAVHLNEDNLIEAPFTCTYTTRLDGDVAITGLLNGVNVTFLILDAVRKRGRETIHGVTVFQSGFNVMGDIDAVTVNGIVLPEQVLTKANDQTITGLYRFQSGLSISGNVVNQGLVNGIDISAFANAIARVDRDNVFQGRLLFTTPTRVDGGVSVTHLTNNVDLSLVVDDAVFKFGDQLITGRKVLVAPLESRSDVDTQTVNGVHLPSFLDDVVFIDGTHHIEERKTFVGEFTVSQNLLVDGTANGGLVNGVDLVQFSQESAYLHQPTILHGTKSFASFAEVRGNLSILGGINGIKLPFDAILLHLSPGGTSQVITGVKQFTNDVHFTDNLFVDGLVNGKHLPSEAQNTLLLYGDQILTGPKTSHGLITFMADVFPKTVNDMDLDGSLVFLDGDQTLSGILHFLNGIRVYKNLVVNGFVNNVDVPKMAAEAVYLDTSQVIAAPFSFDQTIVTKNMSVLGTVDGVDLDVFFDNVVHFRRTVGEGKSILGLALNAHKHISGYLEGTLKDAYAALDNVVLHQIITETYGTWVDVNLETNELAIRNRFVNNSKVEVHDLNVGEDGRFVVGGVHYSDTVRTHYFRMDGSWHEIYQALPGSETVISRAGRKLTSLGDQIVDLAVVEQVDGALVVIATLLADGKVGIASLTPQDTRQSFLDFSSFAEVGLEATSVAIFDVKGEVFVVVGRKSAPSSCQVGSSLLLHWRDMQTLILVQEIPVGGVVRVAYFHRNNKHYVVFADATPQRVSLEPQFIKVYRSCEKETVPLTLFQKIPFHNPTFVNVFELGASVQDTFMIASNKSTIEIFRYEGEAGFSSLFSVSASNVRAVQPYILRGTLYFVVAQGEGCGGSKIFKANMRGSSLSSLTLFFWN